MEGYEDSREQTGDRFSGLHTTCQVVGIYAAAPNHRWTEQPESLAASSVLVLMKTEYGKVLLWLLEEERQK